MNKTIIGKECRFAVHIPKNDTRQNDYHLIKEQVHYDDGTSGQNVIMAKDFQRSFYVTKKAFQNHQSKKEWEEKDHLIEYHCSQSDLRDRIAKAIGKQWSKEKLRKILDTPFVYGADISSSSLIKKKYKDKYPKFETGYSVATFDIEFDVIGDDGIILITTVFKDQIHTVVIKKFIKGIADPINKLDSLMNKYLNDYIKKYNFNVETEIAEDELDAIRLSFKKIHEWKPDFLSIWNMNYDIPQIISACDKYSVDPATFFSDPSVPKHMRVFKYHQGKNKKVTASGKVIPISPAAQWHYVESTSSFYIIDAMCSYKHIRQGKQEEASYALDAILDKELGIRKLKFKECDEYTGLKWHQEMQERFKLEYIVYNRFDCISMIELEQKTRDVSLTIPMFSGFSDFSIFNSQPKRATDALYYYCLENDMVIGTSGTGLDEDIDDDLLDLSSWIVTLPAHMVDDNGLQCIKESPDIKSNIRYAVADLDVSSAYPHGQICYNISKETTRKEIISIEDVPESVFRMQNINLFSGHVNSIEYCTRMFGFPTADDLLKLIDSEHSCS